MNKKIGIIALVLLILIGGSLFFMQSRTTSTITTIDITQTGGITKTISVDGGDFYFKPNQIIVKKGDSVTIIFTNIDSDDDHDFILEGYNLKTEVIKPHQTGKIQLTADKAGTFQFLCNVEGHSERGMRGSLIVKEF
jgi:cytochrome c oxidase subunit 2